MSELIAERLRRRIRTSGAGPLITYYDLASGERTELSAVTFGTWVDKTSNLMVDELSIEAGALIELELARTHPGHWVTLIWELATWQVGAVVTLGRAADAAVLVVGPSPSAGSGATGGSLPAGRAQGEGGQRRQLVMCSLHPLGLGLPGPVPPGVIDYSAEVRHQPDRHVSAPVDPDSAAWDELLPDTLPGGPESWLASPAGPSADRQAQGGHRRLAQLELVTGQSGPPRRRLLKPADAWSAASALVDAILSDGSLVVVVGSPDLDRLARIAEDERAFS